MKHLKSWNLHFRRKLAIWFDKESFERQLHALGISIKDFLPVTSTYQHYSRFNGNRHCRIEVILTFIWKFAKIYSKIVLFFRPFLLPIDALFSIYLLEFQTESIIYLKSLDLVTTIAVSGVEEERSSSKCPNLPFFRLYGKTSCRFIQSWISHSIWNSIQ